MEGDSARHIMPILEVFIFLSSFVVSPFERRDPVVPHMILS